MFSRATRRVASAAKRAGVRSFHAQKGAVSTASISAPTATLAVAAVAAGIAVGSVAQAEAKKVSPYTGVAGTSQERTFIAVKPDGVQRGLVNEVIARFERKGYKIVAMKMMTPTEARARAHYADLSEKPFFNGLVEYFTSGPIVCLVFEGTDVILTGRKILGATNPNNAAPGTLRGDNCISTGRNLVHGSDGPESAAHEIGMWFKEEELNDYERALDSWIVADN